MCKSEQREPFQEQEEVMLEPGLREEQARIWLGKEVAWVWGILEPSCLNIRHKVKSKFIKA